MMKSLRRHAVRIVIGVTLLVVVYATLAIWMPYQRERRFEAMIQGFCPHVVVEWQYCGPDWIPKSIAEKAYFCNRITSLAIFGPHSTDAALEQLNNLTHLQLLYLPGSDVTDVGLKCLRGQTELRHLGIANAAITDVGVEHIACLTKLETLSLLGTKVTDAGLESLQGLTNLRSLNLDGTRTTPEGRTKLQEVLPDCKVWPGPGRSNPRSVGTPL